MKNKFIIFAVLFIVVISAEEDTSENELAEYLYTGEEADDCKKLTDNCHTVTIPDKNYECCYVIEEYQSERDQKCYPVKISKLVEFAEIIDRENIELSIHCGAEGKKQGEEEAACRKLKENCDSVTLSDENYKCCLVTYKDQDFPDFIEEQCQVFKPSKIDDWIKNNHNLGIDAIVNCYDDGKTSTDSPNQTSNDSGNEIDDSCSSSYLSISLIILLSLLF